MTHQKLNKMGKPNREISFHSYVNHLPLSLLFPSWVSVLLRLGPLSCPREDDSQRKQKAQARKRYRTDSGLWGKKMNPKLLMPSLSAGLNSMPWTGLSCCWVFWQCEYGGTGRPRKTHSRQNSSICPSIFPFVLWYSVSTTLRQALGW